MPLLPFRSIKDTIGRTQWAVDVDFIKLMTRPVLDALAAAHPSPCAEEGKLTDEEIDRIARELRPGDMQKRESFFENGARAALKYVRDHYLATRSDQTT